MAKIVDTELNSSEEKIEAKTPNTEIQKGGTRPSQSKIKGKATLLAYTQGREPKVISLKIVSWNVKGLGNLKKNISITALLRKFKADIIMLHETKRM